tara:strand:+ start:1041 stop:1907 length:867 start_codon:yes stop_codon:yes gene_type:complete
MKLFSLSASLFDKFFSQKNRNFVEKLTIWLALFGFIIHLLIILLNNNDIVNLNTEYPLLTSPISAIYTPFSIILYYEVFLLVYYLPRSFTTSVLKQFEIISLILIRRIFYDIPKLEINTNWLKNTDNLQLVFELTGILIIFFLIYLFSKIKQEIIPIKKSGSVETFIKSKKAVSLFLIPIMIYLFLSSIISLNSYSVTSFYDINEVFYNEFFSLLIIADVLILLLSFEYYSERYSQIMRNTGFIICTVLIRSSFSASGLASLLLIISSILFGLLILKIYSAMNKIEVN